MAKFETTITGDFDKTVDELEEKIKGGSISATMEEWSDFESNGIRCAVRVFERYSYLGGNRVSLNLTLFQDARGYIHISAITSGGSQALFNKINTFGEEAFLKKFKELL